MHATSECSSPDYIIMILFLLYFHNFGCNNLNIATCKYPQPHNKHLTHFQIPTNYLNCHFSLYFILRTSLLYASYIYVLLYLCCEKMIKMTFFFLKWLLKILNFFTTVIFEMYSNMEEYIQSWKHGRKKQNKGKNTLQEEYWQY